MSVSAIKADKTTGSAEEEGKVPGPRRRLLVGTLLALVAVAAGCWFVLKPTDSAAAPQPGETVALEPIQINLAAGRYLQIGIALQLVEGAHEVEGSKALDATIDLFSGRSITEIEKAEERHELKEKLTHELKEAYNGEVMGVYFTEFVTQ